MSKTNKVHLIMGIIDFFLLVLFASLNFTFGIIITSLILAETVIYLIVKIYLLSKKENQLEESNNEEGQEEATYTHKDSLLTNFEKTFYKKLKHVVPEEYILQAQVNLASVVKKNFNNKFINELSSRNIDFGIFDEDLKPIVLIELNDKSHKQQSRYKRDLKIREILEEANIPLITFYTGYENTESYIEKRLSEYLPLVKTNEVKLPFRPTR